MKVTLFTSNHYRHNYLANLLLKICDKLFLVQENRTLFTGKNKGIYKISPIISNYFSKVKNAEKKIFGEARINCEKKNLKMLPMVGGDLSFCKLRYLKDFLKSDLYLVYGSSIIKNDLAKFLIKKRAINIHAGISPYYRGTDCNFWALFDNKFDMVGSTVHYLSTGIDAGPILYHAVSERVKDPFIYTMSTVKSAFISISNNIKKDTLLQIKSKKQDKSLEIRYNKNKDFTEEKIKKFLKKKVLIDGKTDLTRLTRPYLFEKKNFFK